MTVVAELKQAIVDRLYAALCAAEQAGELDLGGAEWPTIALEVPREKAHGDYATNAALLLARSARKAPRQVAETLVRHFDRQGTFVERVEVAGPGFINFYLDPAWLTAVVREIGRLGTGYGRMAPHGKRVNVEYVSANPTGPLHVGHGRNAVVGDVIANCLEWTGWEVTREHYTNDAGNQVLNFGASLEVRYRQALGEEGLSIPENGYHGEDLVELMRELAEREGDRLLELPAEERRAYLTSYGLKRKLEEIQRVLDKFGVHLDVYFSEQALHDADALMANVRDLKARGHVYEAEGALWLRSTAFGDDKDRVLVRQNGLPTYVAADLAYHRNKYERGFDRLIDVWGADHHGYVPRMKAGIAAMGWDPDTFQVVLYQLVNLLANGVPVQMSKRAGRLVTLEEVIDEVGRDAARFWYVMRSADTTLDFDLELAKKQSEENPVYYVQYAHARVASILRQAQEAGLLPAGFALDKTVVQQLPAWAEEAGVFSEESESDLVKLLAAFPGEVQLAADRLEPHRIARYAQNVAGAFHSFYNACRVIDRAEPERTRLRLMLVDAVRVTVRNALNILGVSAPERM
ncbi:MAG: arginine--tRNA ligase [Bacillota bacterium]|nr:arginine--tRNA ligase [Bacillota bacterium]